MSERLSSDAAAARFALATHLLSERGKCMRKMFLVFAILVTTSIVFTGCDPAANSNTANKPANAVNNATAPANTAAVETDVKKAIADMAASLQKGDAAAFEKLYTENYRFVGPDGSVSTGAERVASMKAGDTKYDSIAYDEVTVRTNAEGNGAVSISRATVKGKNMGRAVDGQFRVTHVWSKTKDGWRLASGQTTPIAAAAPAAGLPTPAKPGDTAPANANTNANAGK
jgi:uncharacterized protein (TIGR02246 family)